LLAASSAAAVELVRGPYLQLLTTTGVTIVWNTDVPAACSLAIRPLSGTNAVISGETDTVCAIPVAGLAPGGQYAYVPRADGAPLISESIFRTDPDPPGQPFSFLVVGDTGSGGADQDAVRDRMLETPADFAVHTGDMVYPEGAAEDYDPKFFSPYRDLIRRLDFWPCLGNHDWNKTTPHGQPWRDAFYTPANNPDQNENYYSFDFGNAHFVVLNSNGNTAPGKAQYTFLDSDLAATTALWKFVVFHHTIYSSGIKHGSDLGIRADLVPLFDGHGVDIVFMGHEHNYERTKPLYANQVVPPGQGTVYITTGGGGKDLYPLGSPLSPFTEYAESVHHFTRVVVDGDSLLEQMIGEDGVVRDAVTLVKGNPPPTSTTSTTTTTRTSTTSTSTSTTHASTTTTTRPRPSTTTTTSTTSTSTSTTHASTTTTTRPQPSTTTTTTSTTSTSTSTTRASTTTTTHPQSSTTTTRTSTTSTSTSTHASTTTTTRPQPSTTTTTTTGTSTTSTSTSTTRASTTTTTRPRPSTTTTTTTSTSTTTTGPPAPGCVPPDCDDGNPCTVDRCEEGSRCANTEATGFDSVRCVFLRAGLQTSLCSGVSLPAAITARFDRAHTLVDRAAEKPRPRQAKRSLRRAMRILKRASHVAARLGRRHKLDPDCVTDLRRVLDDGWGRARVLLREL
jgi:hypothetical protein